ncbi:thiazole biosynthesis protein [candidate division WOR-3 bacterium]|nr:thiazole biosynthesis protein [candidate division WOR-3 bacterium]
MKLDDIEISRAIIENFYKKLIDSLELDVALVGAGPSNLITGVLLGEKKIKTAVFESKLAPGGGVWGGGMMFNEVVVQDAALHLFDKVGVGYEKKKKGYYTADSVELASTLISKCVKSGVKIFNLIKVVDVMFREENGEKRVNGLVLQWSPIESIGLHVDPLTVRARFIVDGTGHPAEVCSVLSRKMGVKLDSRTGGVIGEMSMWADRGEELTVENASEVFPGLFVTGMAGNAVKGTPRMGPIFGGMLLSGEKIAKIISQKLGK